MCTLRITSTVVWVQAKRDIRPRRERPYYFRLPLLVCPKGSQKSHEQSCDMLTPRRTVFVCDILRLRIVRLVLFVISTAIVVPKITVFVLFEGFVVFLVFAHGLFSI